MSLKLHMLAERTGSAHLHSSTGRTACGISVDRPPRTPVHGEWQVNRGMSGAGCRAVDDHEFEPGRESCQKCTERWARGDATIVT